MGSKGWMSTREAAKFLDVTKPQIFRLIKEKKLIAKLDEIAPVPYYQIDMDSVIEYKSKPKNKGGRPKRRSRIL